MAIITVAAGEAHKNLETVRELYRQLLAAGVDRQSTVVALGGGVIGDMAGFVAATLYARCASRSMPNHGIVHGRRQCGRQSRRRPTPGQEPGWGLSSSRRAVIADLETLVTLPEADFTAGLAEIVKAGLIASPRSLEPATIHALATRLQYPILNPGHAIPDRRIDNDQEGCCRSRSL